MRKDCPWWAASAGNLDIAEGQMNRIVDWYWSHGLRRPVEWTLGLQGLNTVMGIANRDAAIRRARCSGRAKSCVAFWGPSQSGKSSLLSHYIDGDGDGDLALTWDAGRKVRFSAGRGGGSDNADVTFNPFNCGMDASGLVTRFYIPTDDEREAIDPAAPVEVLFADQRQILHAIAVGYRMECQESENPWGLDALRGKVSSPSVKPSRDAFELLFDVCDVCENIARENSRYREFANGVALRQQILGSKYVDDTKLALELAAYLLWDGEPALSRLFEAVSTANHLLYSDLAPFAESGKTARRAFASMEVAALLEDIGILSFHAQRSGEAHSPEAVRRLNALDSIRVSATPRGIVYTCGGETPADAFKTAPVSIEEFGRLQAVIGELRIPLRRTEREASKAFFSFLETCDLLDIPGVTNKASGEAQGMQNLVDLSAGTDEIALLSRVYKTGKTLSIVYGQTAACSIDSFVVFVDLERAGGISRPAAIVNGVRAWLSPYGFRSFDERLPLRLYLNCSLFGKLQDKVAAAVSGGGLGDYCRKAEALEFVKSPDVDCFFTSNRFAVCDDADKRRYFEEDAEFRQTLLRSSVARESLCAVFADGLGTDFMFARLRGDMGASAREGLYHEVERRDRATLEAELAHMLPAEDDRASERRREVVAEIRSRIDRMASEGKASELRRLLEAFVKSVFVVDPARLDFIPRTPNSLPDSELKEYLQSQIGRWVKSRRDAIAGGGAFSRLVADGELYPFLEAVSSIDLDGVVRLLKTDFWNHDEKVSRGFLAMALNNCFLRGDCARKGLSKADVEKWGMLGAAFVTRLGQLAATSCARAGARPAFIEGDAELLEIVKALNLRKASGVTEHE